MNRILTSSDIKEPDEVGTQFQKEELEQRLSESNLVLQALSEPANFAHKVHTKGVKLALDQINTAGLLQTALLMERDGNKKAALAIREIAVPTSLASGRIEEPSGATSEFGRENGPKASLKDVLALRERYMRLFEDLNITEEDTVIPPDGTALVFAGYRTGTRIHVRNTPEPNTPQGLLTDPGELEAEWANYQRSAV